MQMVETNEKINSNYTIFPITNMEIWSFYKELLNSFWTVNTFKSKIFLNDNKKKALASICIFLGEIKSNIKTSENMMVKLQSFYQDKEMNFLVSQINHVNLVHIELYNTILQNLGIEHAILDKLFNDIMKKSIHTKMRLKIQNIVNTNDKEQYLSECFCYYRIFHSSLHYLISQCDRSYINYELIEYSNRLHQDIEFISDIFYKLLNCNSGSNMDNFTHILTNYRSLQISLLRDIVAEYVIDETDGVEQYIDNSLIKYGFSK
jgi:hypothetical protein